MAAGFPGYEVIISAINSGSAQIVPYGQEGGQALRLGNTVYPMTNDWAMTPIYETKNNYWQDETGQTHWDSVSVPTGKYRIRSRDNNNVFNEIVVGSDESGKINAYNPTVYQTGSNVGTGFTGGLQELASSPAGMIAIAFIAPQLGASIASSLAVSEAVGTAIASAALQIAAGSDPSTAVQNAVTSAVTSTGSTAVAKEINTALQAVVENPKLAAEISNAAGSALNSAAITAARGGTTEEIISNAVAGATGSVVATETGEKALGAATTGGLTGGLQGAALGAAGALGRDIAGADTTGTQTAVDTGAQATDVAQTSVQPALPEQPAAPSFGFAAPMMTVPIDTTSFEVATPTQQQQILDVIQQAQAPAEFGTVVGEPVAAAGGVTPGGETGVTKPNWLELAPGETTVGTVSPGDEGTQRIEVFRPNPTDPDKSTSYTAVFDPATNSVSYETSYADPEGMGGGYVVSSETKPSWTFEESQILPSQAEQTVTTQEELNQQILDLLKPYETTTDVAQTPVDLIQFPTEFAKTPTDVTQTQIADITPVTPSQVGGLEPISAPTEPVSTPVEGVVTPPGEVTGVTPVVTETPTSTAPQGIPIPDQISQVTGGAGGVTPTETTTVDAGAVSGIPGVTDTGVGAGTISDTGAIPGVGVDTGAGTGAVSGAGEIAGTGTEAGAGAGTGTELGTDTGTGAGTGVVAGTGEGTGAGVGAGAGEGAGAGVGTGAGDGTGSGTGTGGGISPTDQQIIDLISEETPVDTETTPTEEQIAPDPYKPEFFVAGGVAPTLQTRRPTLVQTLQTPFYSPLTTTGLTSYRGAGEIESSETGGKRRNVWNEASLRLKDALGI